MAGQNWVIQTKRADFTALGEQFHIDPVVARILVNRGLEEEEFESFLHPKLEDLHSPLLMEDMSRAVRILIHDMEEGHRIRIVSDYDVDGVMSNYVLYKGLKRLGAEVDYVIPHRVKDGYGINEDIVVAAHKEGIHTLVTCDNGISANAALSKAKELGMTVIVTDHHQIPSMKDGERIVEILPPADAILNPKKATCKYPFKDLCGAGVAFKLIEALYEKKDIPKEEVYGFLEYVAMATICDVVTLKNENRILVVKGLERLNHLENKGLKALISANELSGVTLDTYHVGYKIGPCINASGRLESAIASMQLLLEENNDMAIAKAAEIREMNEERKELTLQGIEVAKEMIESRDNQKVKVIYLPDCHESIAGIIAGRLRDLYYHPVLVLCDSDTEGVLKGSGRSIETYHLFEALQQCGELLIQYGGHAMAAGFSIPKENLSEFEEKINELCSLEEKDFLQKVKIDVAMPMSYITEELIAQIDELAPFGKGNEKPAFAEKDLNVLSAKILGKERNVVKLVLENKDGYIGEAIYFNAPEFEANIVEWFGREEYDKLLHGWLNNIVLNVVYYPAVNEFNGNRTIQLQVKRYAMAAVREVL